ncbi:MAG TPA: glycosyltransferase family 1 protein [Vicinamibacterales bacterium]|nr:glycosyltransferase family 1 protein [Vicinamibacterales bacterium]
MRILLDYRPALRERTGVGEYAHELAAALARRLQPPDALTLFSSSWKDRLAPARVAGAAQVDVRVPVGVLNAAWHRLGWPPVELFAGAIDIAHSMHPLLMPARRARQVITVHDLDFLDHPERTRGEIRRDYAALAPAHAARADLVVTVSQFTAGEVQRRLGVPREKIAVCSPGAPAWAARPDRRPAGPILFMGTLEPRKNVGVLLAAYAGLLRGRTNDAEARRPVPELWLAGGATPAAADWLRAIEQPPLAGHVKQLGYVESQRRYDLYTQASMLVLPSHLEGFGIPALEAMTAGVPVIVSNRGALPEVTGGAAQVIEPDDVEGLARAMERYLDDAEGAATSAARNGVLRARQYSWDASAAGLLARYRELA